MSDTAGIDWQIPSPFESFNARALQPQQVARTFIPPRQFDLLVLRAHNLVIGPRGSGKTTLLRMLQAEALSSWDHERANEFRSRVDFTGVFVPSHITWSKQLDALEGLGFERTHAQLFSRAAFSTSVFKAFVEALRYRLAETQEIGQKYRAVEATAHKESELARELADALNVPLRVPSMLGLKASLGARLSFLEQLASSEGIRGEAGRSERLAGHSELHFDFLAGISACLDRVEMVLPQTMNERWALLFDEIELAPETVRATLLASLRSVDDRLLFKLSVSPYNVDIANLRDALEAKAAMPGHDYEEVVLTYGRKEESYDFCEQLFLKLVAERFRPVSTAEKILGRSPLETEPSEWRGDRTAYRSGTRLVMQLHELAKIDRSFRDYLSRKRLDLNRLDDLSPDERAAELRKITPLVTLRLAFRTSDEEFATSGRRVRSRKSSSIYSGATSLFAMVEGNPRWLIGTSLRLLDRATPSGRVRPNAQMAEVSLAIARFRALLRTIPVPPRDGVPQRGLLSVLDDLGEYVFDEVVVGDFNPDPVGTFIVDSRSPDWVIEAVGRSLNSGALIYVPDAEGEALLSSLRGKRFRLAYLFAPHYRIPLRLGREIRTSRIFPRKKDQNLRLFESEVMQ